eukprot:TRINITY_DN14141_c0_g6_i2.p1 TRINITY_DN14141_c0_g6~~TRINITY_DN14141_c0_g6_i2.p1  ORF type:complete len:372 (-),score=21.19 TRINITY_DN14141_c0_g6_i2:197-1312(-)
MLTFTILDAVLLIAMVITLAVRGRIKVRAFFLQALEHVGISRKEDDSKKSEGHGEEDVHIASWTKARSEALRSNFSNLSIQDGIERLLARLSPRASCWLEANSLAASLENAVSVVISTVGVEAFAYSNLSREQSCGLVLNIKTHVRKDYDIRECDKLVMRSQGKALLNSAEAVHVVNALELVCRLLKEKQLISFAKTKGSAAMPFAELRLRQRERGKIRAILYIDHEVPRWTENALEKMQAMFSNGRNLAYVVIWWATERGLLLAGRTDHSKAHFGTYAWSILALTFLEQHDTVHRHASVFALFEAFVSYCMGHNYFVYGDATSLVDPFGHKVRLASMLSNTGHRQILDELERTWQVLTNPDALFAQMVGD